MVVFEECQSGLCDALKCLNVPHWTCFRAPCKEQGAGTKWHVVSMWIKLGGSYCNQILGKALV